MKPYELDARWKSTSCSSEVLDQIGSVWTATQSSNGKTSSQELALSAVYAITQKHAALTNKEPVANANMLAVLQFAKSSGSGAWIAVNVLQSIIDRDPGLAKSVALAPALHAGAQNDGTVFEKLNVVKKELTRSGVELSQSAPIGNCGKACAPAFA